MRAAPAALVAALLLGGCGFGGPAIGGSGLTAGPEWRDVPDRRTGGSSDPVPTWRFEGADGDALTFSVVLRNEGEEPVEVTGVRRDRDGDDRLFAPETLDAPVTLGAGEERRVRVRGRLSGCERAGGGVFGKNGQRFALAGGGTSDVDFEGLLELECR